MLTIFHIINIIQRNIINVVLNGLRCKDFIITYIAVNQSKSYKNT